MWIFWDLNKLGFSPSLSRVSSSDFLPRIKRSAWSPQLQSSLPGTPHWPVWTESKSSFHFPLLQTVHWQEGKSHLSSPSLSRHWGCYRAYTEVLKAGQERRSSTEVQAGSQPLTPNTHARPPVRRKMPRSTSTPKCLAVKMSQLLLDHPWAWPTEGKPSLWQ